MRSNRPPVVLLSGVAGAGKTTIGHMLATHYAWTFINGDDLHPPQNKMRMRSGVPLRDDDRWPWLEAIRNVLKDLLVQEIPAIVECSALKEEYRKFLLNNLLDVSLLFLVVDYSTAYRRIVSRSGHFFQENLLASQFRILEPPPDRFCVDASRSPEAVFRNIVMRLGLDS